jgi:hypothetical protein
MGLVTVPCNAVLDGIFGDVSYNAPNTLYCALSTTTPTAAGANFTEPVGGDYARVSVANNATNFPGAASRAKVTGAAIAFPLASGAWGTVTHFGFYDAATNGNLIAWGALTTPRAIGNGQTATFALGAVAISVAA